MQDIISTLKNALQQAEAGLEVAVGRLAKDSTNRGDFKPSEVLALACVREALAMPVTCLHQIQEPTAVHAAQPIAWPKNAQDVRDFFNSDFISAQFAAEDHAPSDEDRYLISAHDFLSAVNWWANFPHIPRPPQAMPTTGSVSNATCHPTQFDAGNSGNNTPQAAPAAVAVPERWCPDVCPITGRRFFGWFEHWKTGQQVPTYGGPFDSYTIPVKDQDGTFSCERFDHDVGEWMTEGMGWCDIGLQLVDDQAFVVQANNSRYDEIRDFAEGRAALAATPAAAAQVVLPEPHASGQVDNTVIFHFDDAAQAREFYSATQSLQLSVAAPQAQSDARDAQLLAFAVSEIRRDEMTDSALLDAMEQKRIAVVPEYEGPWDAEIYNDEGKPNHRGSGSTPREAIRAAIAAQAAQQGGAA